MTDFIRQIRPANDKCLPFHVDNLFLIFVIIGCQKDCFVGLPLHINNVSSTNCKRLTLTIFLPTFMPVYRFSLTAWFTIPDRPCATIKNKKGAIGSPCLNPLVGLNCLVGLPFTITEIVVDSKHSLIKLIHCL